MVNALKNQYYDYFTNLDFSIQKSVPLMTMGSGSLAASGVPEPGTAVLCLMAILGCRLRRRSRTR